MGTVLMQLTLELFMKVYIMYNVYNKLQLTKIRHRNT